MIKKKKIDSKSRNFKFFFLKKRNEKIFLDKKQDSQKLNIFHDPNLCYYELKLLKLILYFLKFKKTPSLKKKKQIYKIKQI